MWNRILSRSADTIERPRDRSLQFACHLEILLFQTDRTFSLEHSDAQPGSKGHPFWNGDGLPVLEPIEIRWRENLYLLKGHPSGVDI